MLLDVDHCALRLERHVEPPAGMEGLGTDTDFEVATLPAGFVDALFGAEAHAVLRPSVEAEVVLYGKAAGVIRSDALVRIDAGPDLPQGIFALGTRVEGTFEPEMALDLLIFLARVVEHAVRRWAPESL
jgi:uncharacterized protein YigA (DUF484 family)